MNYDFFLEICTIYVYMKQISRKKTKTSRSTKSKPIHLNGIDNENNSNSVI